MLSLYVISSAFNKDDIPYGSSAVSFFILLNYVHIILWVFFKFDFSYKHENLAKMRIIITLVLCIGFSPQSKQYRFLQRHKLSNDGKIYIMIYT